MFEQSAEATARALAVTREASKRRAIHAPPVDRDKQAVEIARKMVRRWRRDGFKGRADQWSALAELLGE